MKRKILPNIALVISVLSMILVVLNLFGIVEMPILVVNSLFISLLIIMTWINYKNDKKIQMFVGILLLLVFILLY